MMRPVIAACALLAGCSLWYERRPPCPLPELTQVAVLPIAGAPDGLGERFGEILADELVQFPGIDRVIRPPEANFVLAAHGLDRNAVEDLRDLAQELGAGGVLVAELHEFTMLDSPKAVIRCSLVTHATAATDPGYALRLVRGGALPPPGRAQAPGIYSLERVYDAEAPATSRRLHAYARTFKGEVCGLEGADRVRRIGANFFGFVSQQTIRDLFSLLKETPTDDRSKDSDRKFVYRQG
jgi:hypothetical protein